MTDVITAKIKINFMDTQMGNRFTQGQVRAETIPANGRPGYLSASWPLLSLKSSSTEFFKLKRCLVVNIVIPSWFRQSVRLLGSSPRGQRKHSLGGIRLESLWICCYKQPIQ